MPSCILALTCSEASKSTESDLKARFSMSDLASTTLFSASVSDAFTSHYFAQNDAPSLHPHALAIAGEAQQVRPRYDVYIQYIVDQSRF